MNKWRAVCIECERPLYQASHGICSLCQQQIVKKCYCGCCGEPLPTPQWQCGRCLQQPPYWDAMVVAGRYLAPLSTWIHRFKFQNQFHLDRTLARLMLLAWREARRDYGFTLPQAILPVPLYHRRQWQRGYNQTDLVAKQLAQWLQIPCYNHLIVRAKSTITQRGLTATARRKNLKNAFQLTPAWQTCELQSVILLDDVITTGATLNELSKLLRQQGVKHIQVWGLARV